MPARLVHRIMSAFVAFRVTRRAPACGEARLVTARPMIAAAVATAEEGTRDRPTMREGLSVTADALLAAPASVPRRATRAPRCETSRGSNGGDIREQSAPRKTTATACGREAAADRAPRAASSRGMA